MKTLRRRVTAVVVVGLAFFVIAVSVFFVKIDGKFSHTEAKVDAIRKAQVANVTRNDEIATCSLNDANAVLHAAALALQGDRNAADYPKAIACTLPPMGKKKR